MMFAPTRMMLCDQVMGVFKNSVYRWELMIMMVDHFELKGVGPI